MPKKINLDVIDLTITDQGKDWDFKNKVKDELELTETKINEHLKNQPGLFAWYVVLLEVAEDELRTAKLALEITESMLGQHYRNELIKNKEKATVQQIEERVFVDDKRTEALKEVNEWKKIVGVLNGVKEAFRHRKEALIALASNMRAQGDVEVSVYADKLKRERNKK